jgi:2-amino-4-hydroxy-6-hydroxymethyldihydropteridine diphosphokinase
VEDAFIALGGNLGDRYANLTAAVEELDALPGTRIVELSHVFETEPWGPSEQPDYLNAVARIRTRLRADQLLGYLKDIERELGREAGERYGARTIDLDLLLYADEEWDTEELVVPHPRMTERDFVVTPLLQISPDATLPDGTPVESSTARVGHVKRDEGRLPGADAEWYDWEWSLDAEEDWVEIAAVWGSTAQLNVIESKLRAAGIPHTVSQRPYGERPGLPVGVYPSRVKVPPHLMRQARQSISGPAVVPGRVPPDSEEIRSLDEPALGEPVPGEPLPDQRIPPPSGEYMPEERPERPWWFQLAMILIVFAFVGPFLCRFLGDAIDSLLTAFG